MVWEYSGALFNKSIIGHDIMDVYPAEDCVYHYDPALWATASCDRELVYLCEMSLCEYNLNNNYFLIVEITIDYNKIFCSVLSKL
jgi:hypothetical protein